MPNNFLLKFKYSKVEGATPLNTIGLINVAESPAH